MSSTSTTCWSTTPTPDFYDSFLDILPAIKVAIAAFTRGLAQEVAERGIRVNDRGLGPELDAARGHEASADKNARFTVDTPPAATNDSRYISGEVVGAADGKPLH